MKQWITYLVLSALLIGCSKQEEKIALPLRAVKVQTLSYSSDEQVKSFSGVTKAELEAGLSFRVSGRITNIPVKVGDRLRKSQLVAQLDDKDYAVIHEQAKAELAAANALLRSMDSEYSRTISLYEKRNTSKSQLDTARANAESAKAQVRAAAQQLEAARLQLSYTKLYSPLYCIVSSTPVKENENVSSGQVVVGVNCGNEFEVVVNVPESFINQVKEGQQVEVTLNAVDKMRFSGRVTEISSGNSEQASGFPVTVVLDGTSDALRAGLAAEVEFKKNEGAQEKYFILPVNAVAHDQQGDYVYLLKPGVEPKQGVVQKQYISVNEIVQNGIRVTDGLQAGEKLVVAGVTVLRDGMTVKSE